MRIKYPCPYCGKEDSGDIREFGNAVVNCGNCGRIMVIIVKADIRTVAVEGEAERGATSDIPF